MVDPATFRDALAQWPSGVFGVNVLAKDQAEVARRFAGMVPDLPDRFAGAG